MQVQRSKKRILKFLDKICLACEKPFVAHKESTKFCSTNCWAFYQRRLKGLPTTKNLTQNCLQCGIEISNPNGRKRFCKPCVQERRLKYAITCAICKTRFNDYDQNRKCCSMKCGAVYKSFVPKIACKVCGTEFKAHKGRTAAAFCSNACQGKASTLPRVPKKCNYCDKVFLRRPNRGPGNFCSRSCNGKFIRRYSGWFKPGRTDIEELTARALDELGIYYQEQLPIGPWIVDFYIPNRMIAIECDGKYWHSLPRAMRKDKSKDAFMKRIGLTLIRLKEVDIKSDVMAALSTAFSAI